jgi:NAD(P)H-dependent flavin oxidoreductase YrpB (nitropropane dioxygenase family)
MATKYPIICSPMNGVSDVRLAIACYHAGILPSIVQYAYHIDRQLDFNLLETNLAEYANATDYGNLLFACSIDTFNESTLLDMLIKYRVTHVEILDVEDYNIKNIYDLSVRAREHNIIVSPKLLEGFEDVQKIYDLAGPIDCVTIKGPNGAGRSVDALVLEDEIIKIKSAYPNITLIVSGGINTSQDIKRMLDLGADLVSLGTLFSVCEESKVSLLTKQKIIDSTYSDVERLATGATQKALIFSSVEERDENNTLGLFNGIRSGNKGHVYVGTGIDHIHKIEPVQEIVSRLIADL